MSKNIFMELEKLAGIKEELAQKIMQSPLVNGIDIGIMDEHDLNDVGIRVYVSKDNVKFADLGIARRYKGVQVQLIHRNFKLQ